MILSIILQATFKTEINRILADYGVPLVGLVLLLGVINGLASNWSDVNSREPARRKEGFVNVLYVIGYYALAIVVIGGAVALVSKIKLSV